MNTSVIALVAFLTLATGMAALVFFLRDLATAVVGGKSGSQQVRLRRITYLPETAGKQGPVSAFDHWFQRLVLESGISWTPGTAALLVMLAGLAVGGAVFVWCEQELASALAAVAAMIITLVFMSVQRGRHIRKLQQQLPGTLDMLSRSMLAGLSLEEAVELVGSRSAEPLASEFRFCSKQLSMGLSLEAVMRSLVQRVRLSDVKIFTTTLTVHRQTGGNVAEVLQRLAKVIRERLNSRRQIRAATGAGRLSAMLIAFIGPMLFFYLMFFHPQYVEVMLNSALGQTLLLAAATLEIVGMVWTARLLKPVY